jgi:UDP-N-acetylmuramate-alanine ligase
VRGFEVLGSDIKRNRNIDELEKLGAKIFIGHDENNLPEDCIIVVSSVIKEKNPELYERIKTKIFEDKTKIFIKWKKNSKGEMVEDWQDHLHNNDLS